MFISVTIKGLSANFPMKRNVQNIGNSPNELCGKCGDLISVHKCDDKGTECQFSDEKECTEHFRGYIQK